MTEEFKPGDRVVLEGTIFMFRSDLDAPFLVRIESNEGLLYFAESALRHAPVREDAERLREKHVKILVTTKDAICVELDEDLVDADIIAYNEAVWVCKACQNFKPSVTEWEYGVEYVREVRVINGEWPCDVITILDSLAAPQPDFKDAEADLDFNGCPECGDQNPRWVIEGACDRCHATANLVESEEQAAMFKDLARRLAENAIWGFERYTTADMRVTCVECHASQSSLLSSPLQHNENCAISESERLFAEPTEGA